MRDTTTSDKIKQAVAYYYVKKRHGVNFELSVNGWASRKKLLRPDVLTVTMRGWVIAVEVKSSVADYRADKKWQGYRDYCNQLYLATTDELYLKIKHTIPPDVGVLVLVTKPGHKKEGLIVVRKKSKSRELDNDTLKTLLLRLAWRNSDWNRRNKKKTERQYV